ncbi:MAG: polysaccharide deacetylase family protein [Candidatus Faecousia sp.]|nr:polysaccharide deacetylase family protein [Clostridiales bacterium]MDY6180177.1 polysaccharide deacetylase family protein [Candidatus Faecousia sp.]
MRRIFLCLICLSLVLLPAKGAEDVKYVALTFDDGPSGRFTRQLLKGLEARDVKATFLLCGYRMKQYPELTEQIYEAGHEIGCHGYSHSNMQPMSRRDIAGEIEKMQQLLPEGCTMAFLRPPGGCCSDNVRQVAQARGLAILSWSVDPRDWATRDTWAIENTVLQRVKDGDVILLHDMTASSVKAALDIVDNLKGRGFRFVTASRLAVLRGRKLTPGKTYTCFPPRDTAGEKTVASIPSG